MRARGRVRRWSSTLAFGLACASSDGSANAPAGQVPVSPPRGEPTTPAPDPSITAPAIERTDAGVCTPMPKQGDPCRPGDAWCVESWGEPGGHSSALWCRDGTWQREQEVNLE